MTLPRLSFLFALLSLALLASGCIVIADSSEAKFHETRTVPIPDGKTSALRVETQNGHIKITQSAGGQTTVSAEIKAQTQERLDQTRIIADRDSAGELHVTVEWPGGNAKNNEGCSFDIAVPAGASTRAQTTNGPITLSSMEAPAELTTTNGPITVTTHHGAVKANSTNGALVLSDITGDADLTTTNGSIDATAVTGRVTARSTNGALTLGVLSVQPIEATTTNAAIDLTVPKTFTGQLSLSTTNGQIHYDPHPPIHAVSATPHHVSMSIGDNATASSTLQTTNGSIKLRFAN